MSLLGQLHPQYGNKDTVGVLRDIDLALGIGYDHPEFAQLFQSVRNKVIHILAQHPNKGASLRNALFDAKNSLLERQDFSQLDYSSIQGVDHIHWEYQRLMMLRQLLLTNPAKALQSILDRTHAILEEFPFSVDEIHSISTKVNDVTETTFTETIEGIRKKYDHIGIISFLEGCTTQGKMLSQILEFAQTERAGHDGKKQESMEYWDYTNIINLARTRGRITTAVLGKKTKSFTLSGGAGNAFVQLAIIQKFVEDGGTIQSISGTSMGATIAVMIGMIGNDAVKLKGLMTDIAGANQDGTMPVQLKGNEQQMLQVFHRLREKYGINENTTFDDLSIPVVVNAGRQYNGGEQEVLLGGSENVLYSIMASKNVPFFAYGLEEESIISKIKRLGKGGTSIGSILNTLFGNDNTGALGLTPVDETPLIDYAANERGNPTHWLELLGVPQKDIVDIDVGYSSEKGGSSYVRRLFQRATIRDFFAKLRIKENNGIVMDIPLQSQEGYVFPPGIIEKLYKLGLSEYKKYFTSPA